MAIVYDKGDGTAPKVIEAKPLAPYSGTDAQREEIPREINELYNPFSKGPAAERNSPYDRIDARESDRDSSFDRYDSKVVITGDNLASQWGAIQGAIDIVNNGNFAYLPLTQNSNTFAAFALQRAGLQVPDSVIFQGGTDQTFELWTPALNKPLSIHQSPNASSLEDVTGTAVVELDGSITILALANDLNQGGVIKTSANINNKDQTTEVNTSNSDGTSTKTVFDNGTEPWSSETSAFDAYQRLQSQRVVFDGGNQQTKQYDPNNTHPYGELDVSKNSTGQVTTVQITLDQAVTAAGSVGQVLGSAIGAALGGNDLAGRVVAGAVAGLIGQKLAQTFAASLAIDASGQVVSNFATITGFDVAHAGIGAISSFITAELGSALHISGFGAHLFNAAANGFTVSVLEQVRTQIGAGLTFDAAIGAIDWGGAVAGAVNGVNINLAGLLGSYLGHELVEAKTHEGAVGGQLLGAVGSAIGTLIGGIGNFILPGVGALIGTVLGTWIGNHFGTQASPSAVDLLDQAGDHYGFGHYQSADSGSYEAPDQMAAAAAAIVNTYLSAVNGAALDHSKQAVIGYSKNPDVLYVSGVPGNANHSFTDVNDSVHAAALDLLQHTEVIGGDLLMKRAHQNSPSNIPETQLGGGAPGKAQISGAEQLVTLSADLRVAQDYENYLNNREAINAVMAAYPESSFTAGWIATFARVNDLKLNHMSKSDFLGGLVGYLDSVAKAGLGAEAANATVTRPADNSILVEIKVANGVEVPGALSVFADRMNIISDASGQTLQFTVDTGFSASTTQIRAGGESGTAGHDILVGSAGDDTTYGGAGWDFIDGGTGWDHLYGEDGNDILRGGRGNDELQGGLGNDTYVFTRGDGADTVLDEYSVTTTVSQDNWRDEDGDGVNELHHDSITNTDHRDAGKDSLVLGPGIARSDIVLAQSGNDLIVYVKDPAHPGAPLTDSITLQHWFDDPKDRIEKFVFADGTTLDLSSGVLAPYLVPFGETLSRNTVAENTPFGTVVGKVSGFDFNPNAVLHYSIVAAAGPFAINATTGEITVAGTLNYEEASLWQPVVSVSDQYGNALNSAFLIHVTDANDKPVDAWLSFSGLAENSPGGTLAATVAGSDPDAGAVLRYSLSDDAGGRFAINPTTGEIVVVNRLLLDYEAQSSHHITVRTTDQVGPHADRSRRVKARGAVRAGGWRRARRASASMPCIRKRFA
jgi:hypothetical protein